MGNQPTSQKNLLNQSFNTAMYVQRNPKLSDKDVRTIYRLFNQYNQVNGTVDSREVAEHYSHTADSDDLQRLFH